MHKKDTMGLVVISSTKIKLYVGDFLPKPWASTTEHGTKGLTLPTMRRSVSGSCLKSFLKSSFRCLYVGLNTCK